MRKARVDSGIGREGGGLLLCDQRLRSRTSRNRNSQVDKHPDERYTFAATNVRIRDGEPKKGKESVDNRRDSRARERGGSAIKGERYRACVIRYR